MRSAPLMLVGTCAPDGAPAAKFSQRPVVTPSRHYGTVDLFLPCMFDDRLANTELDHGQWNEGRSDLILSTLPVTRSGLIDRCQAWSLPLSCCSCWASFRRMPSCAVTADRYGRWRYQVMAKLQSLAASIHPQLVGRCSGTWPNRFCVSTMQRSMRLLLCQTAGS